ncbi:hypothetical protein [Massilia sp. YIM B02443]|uniref:hypothetical protein n=1 Tax=Massilia sp. YIM B02443 TaxID=3050127 RepID=UPI0025B63D33|nr:hypothetical protein [Massilia sp. YIM B02443]MDN4037293.1 hypothetical protein [Massilia sp. YIM B02443]
MNEWWTYSLSDFLMFSVRSYWRLTELTNRDLWPAQLTIEATGSDASGSPRTILLTYVTLGSTASNLVASVSDGTRTWRYTYDNPSSYAAQLQSITLPDQSSWSVGQVSSLLKSIQYPGAGSCENPGILFPDDRVGTITHPSGAIGRFTLTPTRHARSQVEKDCRYEIATESELIRYPYLFDTYALTRKELIGSTIGTLA